MKRIITTIALMLALTISVTAQHKIYGNLEVYGTIKGQGLSAKSSADTLVMFDQADSLFYKVAVSDLSISSSGGDTYSPWNTLSDGQGDMIVNNVDSADRVYIRHDATFDPLSPTTTNAFISLKPFYGYMQLYPSHTYNLGGASIRLVDLSVRTNYTDNLYIGRNGSGTDTKPNYITAKRNNQTVFKVDTVGNAKFNTIQADSTFRIVNTSPEPDPAFGKIYIHDADSSLRFYDGNQWYEINKTAVTP